MGSNEPVITCKTYKDTVYGLAVKFTSGTVVYMPDKPLSCGAHVWIETEDEVLITTKDGIVSL